jgi:nucleotide-binding universal stress UspA family protein
MTVSRSDTQVSQQVVVGVDGSPASLRALQWAADYASARHLKMNVIVAWDDPFAERFESPMSAGQMLDRLIGHLRAENRRLEIDGQVVQGDAAKTLESASDGAALLVVAQRGHGELVGMLLGSVSEHCITHAKCPVLVYRDEPQDACRGRTEDHRTAATGSAPWERLDQIMRDPGGI